MRGYLRKVQPDLIVIAFDLLLGIILVSIGHFGANSLVLFAGLILVAGGAIAGTIRLALHSR